MDSKLSINFIKLANIITSESNTDQFIVAAYHLAMITFDDRDRSSFLSFTEQHQLYLKLLDPNHSLDNGKIFWGKIIDHANILLDSLSVDEPAIGIPIPCEYRIRRNDQGVTTIFDIHKKYFENENLNVDIEKAKLSIQFIQLINNNLNLIDRIKRCEKCRNFFFQASKHEKKFCTARCSNAERQNRFQKTTTTGRRTRIKKNKKQI